MGLFHTGCRRSPDADFHCALTSPRPPCVPAWENKIVGCDPQAVHRLLGRVPPVSSASATTKCCVLCHCCASGTETTT